LPIIGYIWRTLNLKTHKMKKLYFTLGLGVLLMGANAQQKVKTKQKFAGEPVATKARNGHATPQATIWSDDFSVASNWTMTHTGTTTAANADWTIGTTPGAGTYSIGAIASTSASNGYALFDSDANCSGDQIANMTTTNSFSTLGHSAVRLRFQQFYEKWYDSTRVYVSNNGTTWTRFAINDAVAQNVPTANPDNVTIDISSVAANQATVWIRFTFYSPASVYGANAGCGYNWLIDDAIVEDIPAADGAITAVSISAPDCDLTSTEKVMVDIKNNGAAPLTGFSVSYKVNALAAVVETYTASIAAGATATYTFNATADFSAPGVVQMVATSLTVTADSDPSNDKDTAYTEDLVPTVDTLSETLETTSRLLGWAFLGNNPGAWYLSGVQHTASGTAALGFNNGATVTTGIDDWAMTSCVHLTAGTTYFVEYWSVVPTNTVSTYDATLDIKIGNDNTIAAMTQSIATVTVNTSAYTMHHHTFTVSATGNYNVGFHVTPGAAPGTWFRMDDINIGREPSSGVKVVNGKELSVYPNPTTGVLNINATAANATVEFYNAMGQNVMSKSLTNGANAIDMTGLSSGVYSVRIIQNGTATITKVIKN
jgi:hypothetical protein